MYDRQLWKCLKCGRERVYGNTPKPDYGDSPVPPEIAKRVLLVCEGACNKNRLTKIHTPHVHTRTLFPAEIQ